MFTYASEHQRAQITRIVQNLDKVGKNAAQPNRRRAERVPLRAPMNAILLATDGTPSINIFSRNLSRSGIAFVSRRPFSKGERVAISFTLPGHPHRLVLARVVHARHVQNDIHEVGAEFLEALPDAQPGDAIPPHWILGTSS